MHIGALLSLTGSWATLGQTSEAALDVAEADVNRYLAGLGSRRRVEVEVVDTQLDPTQAAAALHDFARRGVRVVVGPQSSAEVRAVKPIADAEGVLVISQGSTAHSLAIDGDNIFRLCPDDQQEGPAIAALMRQQGIRAFIGASRDDDGNRGLQTSTGAAFAAAGGVVLDGLLYPSTETDFTALASQLAHRVDAAVAVYGSAGVAVYLTAFDEAASLFEAAAAHPMLGAVRWYGSDGVVSSQALLAPASASFAMQVVYPCPIFGLAREAEPLWQPVSQEVESATGLVPDAFALSTYDAVWLAALADLQAADTGDLARYKDAFVRTAETYFGATGWTRLNAAGDRASGAFDYKGICSDLGGPAWQSIGGYEPSGEVRFTGCAAAQP